LTTPRKVDVGGYQLSCRTFGLGEPTVVFECGIEDTSESLANLAHHVQTFTRAFIYDRAGLGLSDPAPRPRTIQNAVNDLHVLLQRAHIPGPYLLVGHSFGGLIVRLYAAHYPQEVVGLVLLDVPHPELALRELALLPPPSSHEPAALTSFRNHATLEWNDPSRNREGFDIAASAGQILNSCNLGALPLVVITAGGDEWEDGFPAGTARALEQDWMRMQHEFLKLSTNSRHIIATESTHAIQECQPELVIATIRQLLEGTSR
jgi:pimeloyl-ACP methyl ester carboxylesterase